MKNLNALTGRKNLFYPLTLSLVLLLGLTGCFEGGGSGQEGGTDVVSIPPGDVTYPYKNTRLICDALNSSSDISDMGARQGLVAKLFYLNDSQPRYGNVHDYIEQGQPLDGFTLYFNRLNIPTRPWDRGFVTTTGDVITNQQGTTLYEWFGLEFQTDLKLAANDQPGYYQLAVLSDDGATVQVRNADGTLGETIVDNNGSHPTRMGCAAAPVLLEEGGSLPVTIRYYQGPRYHIAMVMLKRPWLSPEFNPSDVECGQLGNARYFDSTQDPPLATATYQGLMDRGFTTLASGNYSLPSGLINSCNIPAPIITAVEGVNITSDSVTINWVTDAPATSQLEITNVATGEVSLTAVDLRLMNQHSVVASSLQASTLYSIVAISMSDSGKFTRSDVVTVRTRR